MDISPVTQKKKKKTFRGLLEDPSMTLQAFRDLWCHHDALASIHTAHTGTEDKLELVVNLSDMVPVQLF
ncbi:hypothetical protein ABBQ32_001033 [Trebouxia sp. C0010 RCD-2024]